jgi:hypothetical protein
MRKIDFDFINSLQISFIDSYLDSIDKRNALSLKAK